VSKAVKKTPPAREMRRFPVGGGTSPWCWINIRGACSVVTVSMVSVGVTCFANSAMLSMASAARGSDHPNFPCRCRRTS
jgi:hypothetical protein